MAETVDPLEGLPRVSASQMKTRGWRRIGRLVNGKGPVVVTNHGEAEVVMVSTATYARLRKASKRQEERLDAAEVILRAEWDERLARLREPGARVFMDSLLSRPLRLHGKVKAGEGW